MKSLMEIRNELKQIRYYYVRKIDIDHSFGLTGSSELMNIVNLYNRQMRKASFELYDIYSSLYVENHTQESFAEKMGCTVENIQKKHKKLLLYLQQNIIDN